MAEEGIKLGLGGYMNNYFGFGSHDNDADVDRNATGLFSDGEIWFKGETTLDNGITFGANVQLESFGNTGDIIDEDFAYISGSFGRVNIGSENSAAYLMHYNAPYVGAPVNTGWLSTFVPPDGTSFAGAFRTPALSTFVDYGNDENQITYFTPRFSGFQVGVSYSPTVNFSGNGADFPVQANTDTQFNNGFSVGANFVESFNGIDVAVAGGYRRAEAPDLFGVADIEDWEQISVGANIGFSGFTVGGSYATQDDDVMDSDSFDVGATYSTGPWSVGGAYFNSDTEYGPAIGFAAGGVPGSEIDIDAVTAGVGYQVGPGISASANVYWVDWETDGGDADGLLGILGITYSF